MKLFFLAALHLITACAAQPYAPAPLADQAQSSTTVYVVSHGWHTGFVVPADALQARIPALKTRFTDTPFLEIGWGDKGFYQAQEITTGLTLRAMFWSSGAILHVVAVPRNVRRYFANSEQASFCLSERNYTALLDFIAASFAKDPQGRVQPLKQGIYGDSQFYEGVGTYHLFNTCNKWTAKGLQQAGFDLSPTFKLTAGSVMAQVRGDSHICPQTAP
ncbi:TIGR02117 family protein [Methylovulum psychrotolerans]|uniref:TIGR02117 family protein n=1 Tax=Methylovulum psychrotolerans TaxID=1704499 RepID=A0A2S5CP19_9GAMM|nr:TIGR02117 family protein [Methylovulum psychrotolerans]POZ52544.1 TIGR02117 family protein [Methylovulum psychrotolerans]